MQFTIKIGLKRLIFDSKLNGILVNGVEYLSEKDGKHIFDKAQDIKADEAHVQMSTNTSTLIPVLHILQVPYNSYFNERSAVESQNDITFYWNPTKLSSFYNRYSTDGVAYENREEIIKKAVDFLITSVGTLPLQEEYLTKLSEPCKLLGFYKGFPLFDSSYGLAKLQSRLGIHVGIDTIMISTPMDRYEEDVYQLAEQLFEETGIVFSKKKNRVVFSREQCLLDIFHI